jgi:Spy/CpxP family protein refolding chaperone
LKNLDLTPAQEQNIQTLSSNYRKAVIDKRSQIAKLEVDRETAMRAGNTNQVKKLIDDIAKLNADIEKMRVDHIESIKSELTAEQREKFRR